MIYLFISLNKDVLISKVDIYLTKLEFDYKYNKLDKFFLNNL